MNYNMTVMNATAIKFCFDVINSAYCFLIEHECLVEWAV